MPQTSFPTPIKAHPSARDPLRNFKFRVRFSHPNKKIDAMFHDMGFLSVGGLAVQTDVIPYREGGDNTNTRKMPGLTDFPPLTLVGGVFLAPRNPQVEWMRQLFSVQWGGGRFGDLATAVPNDTTTRNFRCQVDISVLQHPVTRWGPNNSPDSGKQNGAFFRVYNAWPGSVQFNDLNAGDNSIFISSMTLNHEGWEPFFGKYAKEEARLSWEEDEDEDTAT
jgi:phage tail-like protein